MYWDLSPGRLGLPPQHHMADLILLFPRQSMKQCAAFLVYHPERRLVMPKVSLLDWRRLDGICRYSVVRLRDHLYFLGGYRPAKKKYSRQVLRYELSTGTWYYCNKMKTPRADFSAFAYDGKIYCPGGRTTNGALTELMESFEPITNNWYQENPLPAPCAEFACICLEQLSTVILVGGVARSPNGSFRCFNHIWRFGLLKSTNPYLDYEYLWQALPSGVGVPTSLGVRGHQLVFDSAFNRVYLVGGSPLTGKDDDPAVSQNSRLPGLYYFSIEDMKALLDELDKAMELGTVDDISDSLKLCWTRRNIEQCSRAYAAVSLIGNKLFVVGGSQVKPPPPKTPSLTEETTAQELSEAEAPGLKVVEEEAAEHGSASATPQQPEVASGDAGYYDKRRKSFHSLFSLSNSGLDTSELISVTVKLEKSNRDLKPDRLDWLLQWSLW
uniref:Kelch domain containing 4 n=1 Tax=Macrostomum lignano TaxID=282301 RepID=A0A1I8HIT0_9PLAT